MGWVLLYKKKINKNHTLLLQEGAWDECNYINIIVINDYIML